MSYLFLGFCQKMLPKLDIGRDTPCDFSLYFLQSLEQSTFSTSWIFFLPESSSLVSRRGTFQALLI